ncbi:MAG TPA: ATP-binding protein [Acidimicrobiales bacterium]|nr:ATP-binding protein [Acidimicrobiales bacterium]
MAAETFPPDPRSVGAVRRFVADAVRAAGADDPSVDDAVLVASEVATNVVDHARTPFEVDVHIDGGAALVAVRDGSAVGLAARDLRADAEDGRGLHIVGSLALDWGVESHRDGGKVVWWRSALHRGGPDGG